MGRSGSNKGWTNMKKPGLGWRAAVLFAVALGAGAASGSSHREAPFITEMPKVDATDFYMFRSYEPGRENYVTLIANYLPLQDAYGGPNYFTLDPEAVYEIHIDNNGDAVEDLTFRFDFDNELKRLALMVGDDGAQKTVPVPLKNIGPISAEDMSALNVVESYALTLIRGDRRSGSRATLSPDGRAGGRTPATQTPGDDAVAKFMKPVDYIGTKSIPDYENYARSFIYDVDVPGCDSAEQARVFVGQRKESFVVNLGQTFDLINYENPLGERDQGLDDLDDKNITTIALEVPIACLTGGNGDVIGGWTTASIRQARVVDPSPSFEQPERVGGPYAQVSRLGMPLVNEVVIGLPDKNSFNHSEPSGDAKFLDYVTHPTFPELVQIVFAAAGVQAPNVFPRADLVAVFLTGVEGVNQTMTPAEMQRLNVALPVTPAGQQNSLGAALCFVNGMLDTTSPGCDPAGFPNGRRPGDDVVDITLRVAMGFLLPAEAAPSGALPFTDGAFVDASSFDNMFPYLRTPIPGNLAD